MARKRASSLHGKIHQGDCIKGLKRVPAGTVDLAFADPPFNIGFEYDEYDDRLDDDQYLQWSREWMSQIHRVLKSKGTFWLAIGDEYAAELKIEAQKLGFHCRSWVIWYYTFGVNCKMKFTRSHAHLFHFVKDKKDFVFNHQDMDLRVPSARRLVYNDARANPNGRMPDDTWILRPQELVNGFQPDEDTWYFPRVAGTFKERAGFHGCQMPEQLLGRVIRSCSSKGDTVIDPFSGSSTTLAVAKKLNRNFFGFELSKEYVRLGMERLDRISVGDELDGSEEPNMNTLNAKDRKAAKAKGNSTKSKSKAKSKASTKAPASSQQLDLFSTEALIHAELAEELVGLIEAFSGSHRGYSVDRLVADPILNEDFQLACERLSIPGTAAERNRFLFRARKAGKLKQFNVQTTQTTRIDWNHISPFVYASEIAWRQIGTRYCVSLDELFSDPRLAVKFDKLASQFSPGFDPLEYRWAALKLRKERSAARGRVANQTPKQFGIADLNNLQKQKGRAVTDLDFKKLSSGPGVYVIKVRDGSAIYAGETDQLASRLLQTFDPTGPLELWLRHSADLEIFTRELPAVSDHRFARQCLLTKWHKPEWNCAA